MKRPGREHPRHESLPAAFSCFVPDEIWWVRVPAHKMEIFVGYSCFPMCCGWLTILSQFGRAVFRPLFDVMVSIGLMRRRGIAAAVARGRSARERAVHESLPAGSSGFVHGEILGVRLSTHKVLSVGRCATCRDFSRC